MGPRAVFPGSFDPLTVAHLAVAEAVVVQLGVVGVDLTVSVTPLAKEHVDQTPAHERVRSIERHAEVRPWLGARITEHQLLADIAEGYEVIVIGADKWHQLLDVRFYGDSVTQRDAAMARLPRLAIAPRAGVELPSHSPVGDLDVHLLDIDPAHHPVSSTAVRQGRDDWRA